MENNEYTIGYKIGQIDVVIRELQSTISALSKEMILIKKEAAELKRAVGQIEKTME